MEGKTVILCVLILSLVNAQIQIEAGCCQMAVFPPTGIICRDLSPDVCAKTHGCTPSLGPICPLIGNSAQIQAEVGCCPMAIVPPTGIDCFKLSPDVCAKTPGCRPSLGPICPLGNSGAAVIEYCKLGCASSVCNAISTLQISGDEEVVNEVVGQCKNACSAFCTKGSTLEIA